MPVHIIFFVFLLRRYVKSSGDVMMQKDLSRLRTSYRSLKVPCIDRVSKVACREGIVWAVNEHGKLMVRIGVQSGLEEGSEWSHLDG